MHRNVYETLIFFVLIISSEYITLAEEAPDEGSVDDLENLQIQQPEDSRMAKRAWSQLQGSWGKRGLEDNMEGGIKIQQIEDYPNKLRNYDYEPTRFVGYNVISNSEDPGEPQFVEKRAWNSMNGAWGKRTWSKFRGTGKREPGNWNNLRGLWGKRSNDLRSWNKLSSSWGK